jgi:hypothetical protein
MQMQLLRHISRGLLTADLLRETMLIPWQSAPPIRVLASRNRAIAARMRDFPRESDLLENRCLAERLAENHRTQAAPTLQSASDSSMADTAYLVRFKGADLPPELVIAESIEFRGEH